MKIDFERDYLEQGRVDVCAQCEQTKTVYPVFTGTGVNEDGELENKRIDHWLCERCGEAVFGQEEAAKF